MTDTLTIEPIFRAPDGEALHRHSEVNALKFDLYRKLLRDIIKRDYAPPLARDIAERGCPLCGHGEAK